MDMWINSLEDAMRDCALDGVANAFRHLYNSNRGDEMKFTRMILEKVSAQVPQWNNKYRMSTDIKRILQHMVKDEEENKKTKQMLIEEKVESWQIDYTSVTLGPKIAEGRFGEVYKGTLWGKEVAIKRLKSKLTEKMISKLKEEAAVMSSLRHPNITLFMGLVDPPNVCIVMEYIKNGNLYEVIQNTVITDKNFFKMIVDICHGMNYLHNKNILHLDLKPMNLLVDDNLTVKVCDFGLSKTFEENEKNLNLKGATGTILYMAPEVINGKEYDFKADVFSFGVLLYELLYMREHPETNFTIDDSHAFAMIREPLLNNKDPIIPPWWCDLFQELIIRCTSNDPTKRPSFDYILKIFETVDDTDDWFIQRMLSKRIKSFTKNQETHKDMINLDVMSTLHTIIQSIRDIEACYYTVCAMIDLAHASDSPSDNLLLGIECLERFTQTLEDFNKVLSEKGKFRYFQKIIDSTYTVLNVKDRTLDLLLKTNEIVMKRFYNQGCVTYFMKGVINDSFPDSLHHKICIFMTNIVHEINDKNLHQLIEDGLIESFVKLSTISKNHRSQFVGLQALADLSIRDSNVSTILVQKGIKPVQLASRAYLGAVLRQKPPEQEQNINLKINPDENKSDIRSLMSLSFLRARDRITNMKSPEQQAELKFSRFFLNDTLDDDEVVASLWQILREEKDLDNVSTKDVRDKLEKALNMEIKERKEFVDYQIMSNFILFNNLAIVGQMDPPTKITPNIYLGSEWNSSNKKEMKQLGITHILNVAFESPNYFPQEIEYCNIRIKDLEDVNISKYFTIAHKFLDYAIEKKKVVLIHCGLGISRSAAIVVS